MPKLWTDTIEAHRREVRDAILDGAAVLVSELGIASVTMSEIAEEAGIGRATLYKYFSDVQSILLAWHDRQINHHLDRLVDVRDAADPKDRLEAVLAAFAIISHEHHPSTELAALLHHGEHIARAHRKLQGLIGDIIAEGARAGDLRRDVAPSELANFCLEALGAARALPTKAAVDRLVMVTLAGLKAQPALTRRKKNPLASGRRRQ